MRDMSLEMQPEAYEPVVFDASVTIDDIDFDWELFNLVHAQSVREIAAELHAARTLSYDESATHEAQEAILDYLQAEPQGEALAKNATTTPPKTNTADGRDNPAPYFTQEHPISEEVSDEERAILDPERELPSVTLQPEISAKTAPSQKKAEAPILSRRHALGLIGKAAALSVVSYTAVDTIDILLNQGGSSSRAASSNARPQTSASTSTTPQPPAAPTSSPETAPATTEPEIPMAAEPLHIEPKPHFLTPEGALVEHDYLLTLPTIGSRILGFERPGKETDSIGISVNATTIDTLTSAQEPQVVTPQVAAYAAANPPFVPTAERRGKGYWNGNSAGAFQKTAIHAGLSSVYPGQRGNSLILAHGSTKNAGGGDLPALKPGDPLELLRSIDGNRYVFTLAESEVIHVDRNGNLTSEERERQIAKGHSTDVTFGTVAYRYLGNEDKQTLTIQICSDRNGTPGGVNGRGAAEARILYRFVLQRQDIKLRYPAAS